MEIEETYKIFKGDFENKPSGQATLNKIKLAQGIDKHDDPTKLCINNSKISATVNSGYPESSICEIGSGNTYC